MAKLKFSNKQSINNTRTNNIDETFKSIATGISGVAIVVLLVVFPLYTHDMYFDILTARYLFFKVVVIVYLSLMAILGLLYLTIKSYSADGMTAFERFVEVMKPKNLRKHIIATDVFFIIMIIGMCIGTLNAGRYMPESFFGYSGRYQGLECWILYLVLYVLVSRTFKMERIYLDLALICGTCVCLWGITDFFQMDIFGFFVRVQESQKVQFTSSIGNLNTYTNYTAMIFAIASAIFMVEKNPIRTIFYGFVSLISCVASMLGLSDNTVLSFAGFFIFAPFFLIRDNRSVVRFFYLAGIFFFSMFLMYSAYFFGTELSWVQSIFKTLSYTSLRFLFIPFMIIGVLLNFYYIKSSKIELSKNSISKMDENTPKFTNILWGIFVIISFVFVVYIFVDVNVLKSHDELWKSTGFYNEILFNDDWGTHRGHNWRIAFTNFFNFSNLQRIFGYGADTYLVVTERSFHEEMATKYGELYDSAHNEYINYLICQGIVGLVSYLGIFISALRYGFKIRKENKYAAIFSLSVIAYMFQAIINIAIPITTPVFFVSMYIVISCYLESDYRKSLIKY